MKQLLVELNALGVKLRVDGDALLHVSIALLLLDARSIFLFVKEWHQLYAGSAVENMFSHHLFDTHHRELAELTPPAYWRAVGANMHLAP